MIEEHKKFGFGVKFIDNFLDGGLINGLNLMYGPPSVGKTTFAYHFAINTIKNNNGLVVYFDNDHAFNVERFLQIARNNKDLLNFLIIIRPKSSAEFRLMLEKIESFKPKGIIVDSIAMPYRVEFMQHSAKKMVAEMLSDITTIRNCVEEYKIPALLINQIYSRVDGGEKKYEMIGSENLKYMMHIILEIEKMDNYRVLKIHKHPTLPNKDFIFEIDNFGLKPYKRNQQKKVTK